MTRLMSVGNVIIDLTVEVPVLPERGGDVVGRSRGSLAGGSFNTMAAASRQGLSTAYGGAHGTGPLGELARSSLIAEGIEVIHPAIVECDTGFDLALTDAEGERTFVTVFGAEARLERAALDGIRLLAGDFVHVSGYGLLAETNGEALGGWLVGVPEEVTVVFDPGPLVADIPQSLMRVVRDRADWLSCNAREAGLLTGAVSARAAAGILADSSRAVLVRAGADGCFVADADGITRVAGFTVDAVDSNGAGDAHTGAFIAACARGESAVAAARIANACAAIAVSRRGPATAPSYTELQEFLAVVDAALTAGL